MGWNCHDASSTTTAISSTTRVRKFVLFKNRLTRGLRRGAGGGADACEAMNDERAPKFPLFGDGGVAQTILLARVLRLLRSLLSSTPASPICRYAEIPENLKWWRCSTSYLGDQTKHTERYGIRG